MNENQSSDSSNALASGNFFEAFTNWIATQGVSILIGIGFLIVGWFIASRVKALVRAYMRRTDHMDPIVESFLTSLSYYAALAIILIIALNMMGVQTASLIAVLGAASLAIGLSLQSSLSSLAAGVMIILIRPIKVGDYIDAAGDSGTVKSISLFYTELATYDNIQKLIPNSEVWSSNITNYTTYDMRMIEITVGIDYEDDIDEGLNVLRRIATGHDKVLKDPPVNVFVSEIGDSAIGLTVRAHVPNDEYWPIKRELTKSIKMAIEDDGLSFPFPRREVIVKGAANDQQAETAAKAGAAE